MYDIAYDMKCTRMETLSENTYVCLHKKIHHIDWDTFL